MRRRAGTIAGLTFAACTLVALPPARDAAAGTGANREMTSGPSTTTRLMLHSSRELDSDLEITGMVEGLSPHTTGYVRLTELAALPQVTVAVHNDENFGSEPSGTTITGVTLTELAHAVQAVPASNMVDAWCVDKYRTHYPADYIAAHTPILGLKVEGQDPEEWARQSRRKSPGRYFITHADFKPSFTILKHTDEPQVPTEVVRLNFSAMAEMYGVLAPRTPQAAKQTDEGFVIARQNCLRCHNQGAYGGRKAGVEWSVLGMLAHQHTSFFEKYVRAPRSVAPGARMPSNPEYDAATLDALASYFRSVSDEESTKKSGAEHE